MLGCSHQTCGWPWLVLQVAWWLASGGVTLTFSNVFITHVTRIWWDLFSVSEGIPSPRMVQSGLISGSSVGAASDAQEE